MGTVEQPVEFLEQGQVGLTDALVELDQVLSEGRGTFFYWMLSSILL